MAIYIRHVMKGSKIKAVSVAPLKGAAFIDLQWGLSA